MRSYILFLGLIFGFQSGLAMEVDQMEVGQDELNQQLVAAVRSYYDPNQQATVVDRVGDLLNRGANPNILINSHGESPLLRLLRWVNGYENPPIRRRLIELLIKAGADPNLIVIENQRPLYENRPYITTAISLSCAPEDRAIFNLLRERGANLYQRFENNKTLLHAAATRYNLELCEDLVRIGFDVNAVDANGDTPLHSACAEGIGRGLGMQYKILPIIELLLDWGAEINLQNKKRETALHIAIARNGSHAEIRPIVTVLLARGANLQLLSKVWYNKRNLESPLQLASLFHDYELRFKRDYKERRRLCELMITHQVLVNKGALTLLGSLRKIGLEENYIARTLYRNRAQLLTPHLQRLYVPLQELLRRLYLYPYGPDRGTTYLADFQGYLFNFPNSKFNVDFLDPARVRETYRNLNRNIYQGLHQPRIIGLTALNPISNNYSNNEGLIEEPLVETTAQTPHDDEYADYSDDDDNDYWNMVRAQNAARRGQREGVLGMHSSSPEVNRTQQQPAPRTPQLNSNNSQLFFVTLATIGIYSAIGYIIYKHYCNWQEKNAKQEKRKKLENQKKKITPTVDRAPGMVYP